MSPELEKNNWTRGRQRAEQSGRKEQLDIDESSEDLKDFFL